MPASYLHGVETIAVTSGARPVNVVKSAVILLVGTAPTGPINTPTLVMSDVDAAQFGTFTAGYTIPYALDGIFDQGAGLVVVVNVYDPVKHSGNPANVTAADIIGGYNSTTGKRSGLAIAQDCYTLFGFRPKIIIAPGYCTSSSVSTEMLNQANGQRGIALIDAPIGCTYEQVIAGRGASGTINFNTSSERAYLLYPSVKVYDPVANATRIEGMSPRIAGLIASTDQDEGYWVSPSNHEIGGIIGVETSLTAAVNDPNTQVNLLNSNGITSIFNSFGSGLRLWGNRSASYPSSTAVTNFLPVRRTADIIHESIELAMLQFIDSPINQAVVDSIRETVNAFLRTLVGRGALIDGSCTFDKAKNPNTELAAGHLTFDITFLPPTPAERISFQSFIDINLYKGLK
jgi:hypothetical protein